MCLHYNQIEPTHQDKRTVWKILIFSSLSHWHPKELRSVFQTDYIWEPGVNYSSRTNKVLTLTERFDHEVNRGFHVFTSRVAALSYCTKQQVLVEMTVDSCDFVAENTAHREAVYTKVTLSEEEYVKATRS